MLLNLLDCDTLGRILVQHLFNKVLALWCEIEVAWERVHAIADALGSLREVLRVPRISEGIPSHQHDIQMHTHRPDIGCLAIIHLWCLQNLLKHAHPSDLLPWFHSETCHAVFNKSCVLDIVHTKSGGAATCDDHCQRLRLCTVVYWC